MSAPWCQPVPGPAAPARLLDDPPLESPEPASTPCFTPGDRSMPFQPNAGYPLHRPRRLRAHPRLRELTRESLLTVSNLIYPLFVCHGASLRREVPSMPGQYQLSLDRLGEAVSEVAELGIPGILLFGIPEHKDAFGSAATRDDGIVQEAIRITRRKAPNLLIITDLCFCEYTDHGHCGPLSEAGGRLDVDNDATLPKVPPASAIAAATRWTRPTATRRSARSPSTWQRVPTLSWSSRPWPTSTSPAASRTPSASRWRPTTSLASTPWSRPPPSAAGSTSAGSSWKPSPASSAPGST